MIEWIHQCIDDLECHENPFFKAFATDTWERSDFAETQVQFFWAVRHFHRPMNELADRIPIHRNRSGIEQNVRDELGKNDSILSHEASFLLFLKRLYNLDEKEVRVRPIWPEVLAFNAALDQVCGQRHFAEAAAFMGVIELMFADFSNQIGSGVIQKNWLSTADLVHYNVHEKLDIEHAEDFFTVALPDWHERRDAIKASVIEGATVFDDLFRHLHIHRTQRLR